MIVDFVISTVLYVHSTSIQYISSTCVNMRINIRLAETKNIRMKTSTTNKIYSNKWAEQSKNKTKTKNPCAYYDILKNKEGYAQ